MNEVRQRRRIGGRKKVSVRSRAVPGWVRDSAACFEGDFSWTPEGGEFEELSGSESQREGENLRDEMHKTRMQGWERE